MQPTALGVSMRWRWCDAASMPHRSRPVDLAGAVSVDSLPLTTCHESIHHNLNHLPLTNMEQLKDKVSSQLRQQLQGKVGSQLHQQLKLSLVLLVLLLLLLLPLLKLKLRLLLKVME
jgi:hypothetical protein